MDWRSFFHGITALPCTCQVSVINAHDVIDIATLLQGRFLAEYYVIQLLCMCCARDTGPISTFGAFFQVNKLDMPEPEQIISSPPVYIILVLAIVNQT